MQGTKVASFAQPAAGFPARPGDLVLPWRGLVAIGPVNVAMFMLRASAILVLCRRCCSPPSWSAEPTTQESTQDASYPELP